jgi:hypothetical protein
MSEIILPILFKSFIKKMKKSADDSFNPIYLKAV